MKTSSSQKNGSSTMMAAVLHNMRAASQEAVRQQKERAATDEAERRQYEIEEARVASLADRRLKNNLSQAVAGMRAIMAFTQTPDIQEYLKLAAERRFSVACINNGEGEFCFYDGIHNPEDEVRFDQATILIKPGGVWLVGNSYVYCREPNVEIFPYTISDNKLRTRLSKEGDTYWNEAHPIIGPDTQRSGVGSFQVDFDSEGVFSAADIFGRVLIDCATPKKFETYCEITFSRLLQK